MNYKKSQFKILFLAIIFFGVFGLAKSSQAANVYVREGAAGANNGSDWTNAFTELPYHYYFDNYISDVARGNTYYIADGNYPSYTVNTAVSGTSAITIKKATAANHGTDTGWNSSYGDGQAIFDPQFNIAVSYVTFDGVVGSGSDADSYGFRIATPTNCNQNSTMFTFPNDYQATFYNITVSHVALVNCNIPSETYDNRGLYSQSANAYNMTLSYSYIYGNSCNFLLRNWHGGTITHNFFEHNWSTAAFHGEQVSPGSCSDITFAYNTLKDSFVGGVGFHVGNNDGWKVYNNLAYNTDARGVAMGIYGTADDPQQVVTNSTFHHNTTANIIGSGYGSGIQFAGNGNLGNTAYNNIFYNCAYPNIYGGDMAHDYNAFYNCTNVSTSETHIQQSAGDPFVNSVAANFHLSAATIAGMVLSSPYNIDYDGIARGFDGLWDRGAYEYASGGDTTPPAAPSGLAVS